MRKQYCNFAVHFYVNNYGINYLFLIIRINAYVPIYKEIYATLLRLIAIYLSIK